MRVCFVVAFLLALSVATSVEGASPTIDAAAIEFFEKKVRPILVEQCQACHSGKKKRGNLLLDSRAGLLKGGDTGPAVVPGEPVRSLLVKAISYRDQLRMPPRSKLPEEQIAVLTAWVKMGAPWPGPQRSSAGEEKIDLSKRLAHWSFQPVKAASAPQAKDAAWARNPLDRFLLARLEQQGLAPAPPADRRSLLRRLTYDLTGLPPTVDDLRSFLANRSPVAYEQAVDRLLASPAFGERWGRHWLDLMRFAETSGHEFDFEIPHAEGYRDYVLRAVNDDVPYDQFVTEHLAGDLLQSPRRHPVERTNESILGTGFWFLGESKHSPVDLRGDGADRRDNQIDVFGKAFLGLTISCARCHDHKFDPISTREYYSLVSYLQSSRMQRAFLDPPDRITEPAARIAALRAEAAKLAIRQTAEVLEAKLADLPTDHSLFRLRRETVASRNDIDFANGYRDWFVTGDAFGAAPATTKDVVLDATRDQPVRRLWRGAASGKVSGRLQGALRSKTFTIPKRYIHYHIGGKAAKVNLIIDGFQQIRNPIYGGLTFNVNAPLPSWRVQDVSMWVGLRAYVEVLDVGDGHAELDGIAFSDSSSPPSDPPAALHSKATVLRTIRDWRDGREVDRDLLDSILRSEAIAALKGRKPPVSLPALAKLLAQISSLESSLPAPRRGLALADGDGVEERVHIRGNPKTLGEEAPRVLLAAVTSERQAVVRTGSGRLEMARRLTSSANPLFARVVVNRLWHHHFGQGLVRSTDDFGHQGEPPTHPELLDWLAAELVRSDWSLKHLHRLMVLSSAYRMASRSDEMSEKADPRNHLLHRMPIRRLEAEAVRDAMLTVSGRLDRAMFGKGPTPHLTEFMVGRGRPSSSGPLDGAGRRSVYLNVRRNFLTPMFLAFDYPVPFTTIGRRSVSNVPAQALTLLNNPFVIQQAQLWAARELASGGSDEERVKRMYEAAYGREPTFMELRESLDFVTEQEDRARAWADLAHVLFNVKEFIFVS